MSKTNITMADIRAAGVCAAAVRRFFRVHSLDLREFSRTGLPAETLLATGDEQARLVVESILEKRRGREE